MHESGYEFRNDDGRLNISWARSEIGLKLLNFGVSILRRSVRKCINNFQNTGNVMCRCKYIEFAQTFRNRQLSSDTGQ